jgi:hypothetical protein
MASPASPETPSERKRDQEQPVVPFNPDLLDEDSEHEGDISPRKLRKINYAKGIGDGRPYSVQALDRKDKPSVAMLRAEILRRCPSKKPGQWDAQKCSAWLNEHPEVTYFVHFAVRPSFDIIGIITLFFRTVRHWCRGIVYTTEEGR